MIPFHFYFLVTLLLLSSSIGNESFTRGGLILRKDCDKKSLCLRGKVVDVKLVHENKHSIVFDVKLNLEFSNYSRTPIIILQQEFWLGATSLARSPEDATAYKYIYISGHWPSVSTSPEWKALRQRLNQPNPPQALTLVLGEGKSMSYETSTKLYIEKAGSFDKTKQSWEIIKQASPVWLQVTLEMWPVNLEPSVDINSPAFGKMLQRRWRQHGVLQLERLTSEPMPLQL